MTLCAYIRVSTDMQTTENQKFEIERWCEQRGWPRVEKWVSEDGVSGAKDYKKRKL
jgi:DNA invertase Pin-like site-specific DNA recombinase